MSETQNIIEEKPQPKIRDRLFIAIFGEDDERSKRWRLDLYNALNGTNYHRPRRSKAKHNRKRHLRHDVQRRVVFG